MRVAATFVSTLIAVQSFAPEKLFKCSTKPTEVLAPLRATHYESIAEIRQVKVILLIFTAMQFNYRQISSRIYVISL